MLQRSIANFYAWWWLRPGWLRTLHVGGRKRTYVVHPPEGRDRRTPLPVVLALHGSTMNGPLMAWFSDLNTLADEAGFIAVYPNGTGRNWSFTWNGGNCCGSAMRHNIDDVGFIAALLDDLAEVYPVDPRRIYATGLSNGAIMTYRLAAELPDRIAAVAPVAGVMETELGEPQRPVPILHFHGLQDEFVPFHGGRGPKSLSGTNFRSVEETIGMWVERNGCEKIPRIDFLFDGPETSVTRQTYGGGREGSEVVLVAIEGGGHTWPGQQPPVRMLGPSTRHISANRMMWEFFQKHPLA